MEGKGGRAATEVAQVTAQIFDRWQSRAAILNCLYGTELIFSEDMARAVARAVNDWIAKEWLDRDPRLRASITVPTQNVEFAVEEIERCAKDKRFVQVQVLGDAGDAARPPALVADVRGGRAPRPADRHPSGLDLPALDDLARLADLLHRGLHRLCAGVPVAARQPDLRGRVREVSRPQGGAAGVGRDLAAGFLWRISKFWRGVRAEVPWVDRSPADIVRDHVRLTIVPFDAPPDAEVVERIVDHLRSDDILLYASDYPHWQFDGDDALPPGLPDGLRRKILVENPLATYVRLKEDA